MMSVLLPMNGGAAALACRMPDRRLLSSALEMFGFACEAHASARAVSAPQGSATYSISSQKAQIGIWLILVER
jgi:hypothetical protein